MTKSANKSKRGSPAATVDSDGFGHSATGRKFSLGDVVVADGDYVEGRNVGHVIFIRDDIVCWLTALGGITDEDASRLDIYSLRGEGYDKFQNAVAEICNYRQGHYGIIVIDPLYMFYPPKFNENDNSQFAKLYRRLIQFANCTGAAIFVVHHFSKGEQSYKKITDLGSGAGAIARASDAHIVLREHEEADCIVVDGALRDFPPLTPTCWRFDYPIYQPAPELDPLILKGSRTRKAQEPPEKKKRAAMTPAEFVSAFVTEEGQELPYFVAKASEVNIKPATVKNLLDQANSLGLCHKLPGRSRQPSRYSLLQQTP